MSISLVPPAPRFLTPVLLKKMSRILDTHSRKKGLQEVAVRFVSLKEIQQLNRIYRHQNKPTDVLSFATGDIAICLPYARIEAKRRSIPVKEEVIRLFVHGILHLLGYDHQTERQELKMFAIQEQCVEHVLSSSI